MIQTDLHSFSYKKGALCAFCKKCKAQHFYRRGKTESGIPRYQCRSCGFRFVWTSDIPKKRTFSHIVEFAVCLYTDLRKAFSLKGVAEVLADAFGVHVSHEAIRQWVLSRKKVISRRENPQPSTWHVDETYVKIHGDGFWLWIVYDKFGVLSWKLSQKRTMNAARKTLRAAMGVNGGLRPERIITDGLSHYARAIMKEIGWNYREQKKKHIVSGGIGLNWFIERLNREIKRRLKWFSTFQSLKGAKAFFSLWFYHYNQRKSRHIT
jgi:putative transposase